jgi:hypothetical protein
MRRCHRFISVLVFTVLTVMVGPKIVSSADHVERGLQALREGRVETAIDHWTREIQRRPSSYVAHVNRGSAYLFTGHVVRGIEDWHRANQLSPPFAYGLYTGYFVWQGTSRSDMLHYAVALELDPECVASVLMTAAALLDVGRPTMARDLFLKSVDLTKNPLLKGNFEYWAHSLAQPVDP